MITAPRSLPIGHDLPHVEVVVPCYRYGHYLRQCVESIVSQPGVRTTVHVIDDASPDDSFAEALRLAAEFPGVRAARNPVNLGHIATYNKGLAEVEADYVVLLSADDLLAPGALGRATALMEAHPEVGFVYGHPSVFGDEPEPSSSASPVTWSVWPGRHWIERQFRRGLSIIYSPEVVVRAALHHEVGYYRPELPHSGDLEMWLRLADRAAVGRINGRDQAYRRVHPQSMMNTRFAGAVTDLAERQRAYEWHLQCRDDRDRRRLEGIMRRRLAEEALGWAVDCRREAPGDDVAVQLRAAVEYARTVYPPAPDLPIWRLATRSASAEEGWDPVSAAANVWRVLRDKFRWRRWRLLGI